MKCSICHKEGHRSDNKMFHPLDLIESKEKEEIESISHYKNRLEENFIKCVQGYHLVNNEPLKEAPWEDVNVTILQTSGCSIQSQSNGSHKSGGDITCSLGTFSNKSAKYNKQSFVISSYRLTTVCSENNPNNIENIISEINRRKDFNFYSIVVRKEMGEQITYEWFLIPSDYPLLNPSSYEWSLKYGKKNKVVGWETNSIYGSKMSITFSMSSQLWIMLNVTEDIKKFMVSSCSVQRGRKYDYIQLYESILS